MKKRLHKALWVAWEKHRRTIELCKYFGIKGIQLESNSSRLIRHPYFLLRTWSIIHRDRPALLIVQNPSIFLAVLACLLKGIYGYKLVVDAHNAAVIPRDDLHARFFFMYRYVQRTADFTIVTNKNLERIIAGNRGRAIVLPDILPSVPEFPPKKLKGKVNFTLICTFESDEPFGLVIEAARKFISSDIRFNITGNTSKCPVHLLNKAPQNVTFTDFLPDRDYWALLHSSDFIIDLTYREDCLVCGAYEATAAEKPMILSDTKILRAYFGKGVQFTSNSLESIREAIQGCIDRQDELNEEVRQLKAEIGHTWTCHAVKLINTINADKAS